jgi:putative membrane protein insertion efficiency factor
MRAGVAALRRGLWLVGAPFRQLLIGLIRVYRATLSGLLGGQCRFSPSCSVYAEEAIRVHGAAKGVALATWRVARCSPFSRGGHDPVPVRRATTPASEYEGVIRPTTAQRGIR